MLCCRRILVASLVLGLMSTAVCAQTFWFDDFNIDTSDVYEVLEQNPGRDGIVFEFDYSSVGIPEAPSSGGGGTTGVRFFVNDPFEGTDNATTGVQIAPIDLGDVLDGNDYTMTFDVWMNVNGPMPGGGGGSTEAMMAGVGFDGVVPIEAGVTDGTYFTLTGEAGVSTDVRSFTDDGFNGTNADGTSINVASIDLDDDYYAAIFPGGIDVGNLPVQGGQDNQSGITRQGQMAFAWHQVRIDVRDVEVSFYVDDLLISRDKDADIDGTVMVGLADYFSSETDVPEWGFSVVDNLRVVSPLIGDFNGNGVLDGPDIDTLTEQSASGANDQAFDLNADQLVDVADVKVWIKDLLVSWIGDGDLDGEFNSGDLVVVLASGTYETGAASVWSTGDFNGDGQTNTTDLVAALADGGYEQGPRPVLLPVPEPTAGLLAMFAALGVLRLRCRRGCQRGRLVEMR